MRALFSAKSAPLFVVSVLHFYRKIRVKEKIKIKIRVADYLGRPLKGQEVYYSFFQPVDWYELKKSRVTDENGEVTEISLFNGYYA